MKKRFPCEVDCADCAAKITEVIKKVDGVLDANVNFMTQKMMIEADDDRFDAVVKEAVKAGKKVESEFEVTLN